MFQSPIGMKIRQSAVHFLQHFFGDLPRFFGDDENRLTLGEAGLDTLKGPGKDIHEDPGIKCNVEVVKESIGDNDHQIDEDEGVANRD